MIPNRLKAVLLLGTLSALLLIMGRMLGGMQGLQIAFIMALIMNFIAYFFSESIVLNLYRAQSLDKTTYKWIYTMVDELRKPMQIPMPRLWLVNMPIANAFATGRNPSHASVVITAGILDLLSPDELRGVLAHELSHVKNRDILVTTMAATLATAIGYLANMMQYAAMWGQMGSRSDSEKRSSPIAMLIIGMTMPFAAALLQLALSRSREYLADESGAHYSHEPLALASALAKISNHKKFTPANNPVEATTSPLFIVNPLTGATLASLFSTHPPVEQRIKRLEAMAQKKF
jgi:heat shock protein HtpX